ncbi:MAG: hypothetical protein N0C84_00905 [Candidatus Thiodiazotropha taylori]|uniref:Uncharacterized protein n=1 Tax=Candidatus Thiodiazotropha taylori TaxID=2792791 RepID=A0A9E4KAS6_9GAMM|nr:hypothetical protein [Candidatus Thiodiazotropha taylori]MCW4255004.1 hypothetical protein [Candidatus Thiodiazotropha taylori]
MANIIEYIGGIPYKKNDNGTYSVAPLVEKETYDSDLLAVNQKIDDLDVDVLRADVDDLKARFDSEVLEDIMNDSDFRQHLNDWLAGQSTDSDRIVNLEVTRTRLYKSDTMPSDPIYGDVWENTVNGLTYVWTVSNDGNGIWRRS